MIGYVRRLAQFVRHAPIARHLGPLWTLLRGPYLKLIRFLGQKEGILVHVGGHQLRLSPDFATQNWETVEFDSYHAFAASVRRGDVVFDVGAHVGTYTLIALQYIGSGGRVVAYEPYPPTRSYLELHLAWNQGLDRTVVRDVCCGAIAGTADFYCGPGCAEGMNGLIPVNGFLRQSVRVTTLDHEVRALGLVPDIIKIDVEGTEWDVLRGAEETLITHGPVLFLSLHPDALSRVGVEARDIEEWLAARDYDWQVISRDHEVHVVARRADWRRGAKQRLPIE